MEGPTGSELPPPAITPSAAARLTTAEESARPLAEPDVVAAHAAKDAQALATRPDHSMSLTSHVTPPLAAAATADLAGKGTSVLPVMTTALLLKASSLVGRIM